MGVTWCAMFCLFAYCKQRSAFSKRCAFGAVVNYNEKSITQFCAHPHANYSCFSFAGEVDELVDSFKTISVQSNDSGKLIDSLKRIATSVETNASAYEHVNLQAIFLDLMRRANLEADVREQTDRTIAEITKNDAQRKQFTTDAIIDNLLNRLANQTDTRSPLSDTQLMIAIQCCRALGNICYNNEDARNIILKLNGNATIIGLLDLMLDANNELELTFAKFRGGLISNYLLGGEHLAKNAIELHIMAKIEKILDHCIASGHIEQNEEILLNTLPPLSLLTENVADLNFSTKLNEHLAKILTISKHPDVAEICLEMLNYQAENGKLTPNTL